MTIWKPFAGAKVPTAKAAATRPRLSLTSDILSFRRCPKQYGRLAHDGFVPSMAGQIYYGQVIHQVLDRCHQHYWGRYGHPQGTLPSEQDIDAYGEEVTTALRAHGIRPPKEDVRQKVLRVLKLFNTLEGATLYPKVLDTEFRLEADKQAYILRGVVDVLVGDSHDINNLSKREIWDYKGTRFPGLGSKDLQDYTWQMCVYADLYRARTGTLPARAVLYFLNEIDQIPTPTERPPNAVHKIEFTEELITSALAEFDITAKQVIGCKGSGQWPLPTQDPGKDTCSICDFRWSCPIPKPNFQVRLPI